MGPGHPRGQDQGRQLTAELRRCRSPPPGPLAVESQAIPCRIDEHEDADWSETACFRAFAGRVDRAAWSDYKPPAPKRPAALAVPR